VSEQHPSPNGDPKGDRDGRGRFRPGHAGGPGNPHAGDVARARAAFFAAIRDADVVKALATIRAVMAKGKDADRLAAARELLDRVIGRAVQSDLLERIEKLEAMLAAREQNGRN
jgi:hypothetical protein